MKQRRETRQRRIVRNAVQTHHDHPCAEQIYEDVNAIDSRTDRHYHMICMKCGTVIDVPMNYRNEIDLQIEEETGYRVSRHRIIVEGLCPDCRSCDKKE